MFPLVHLICPSYHLQFCIEREKLETRTLIRQDIPSHTVYNTSQTRNSYQEQAGWLRRFFKSRYLEEGPWVTLLMQPSPCRLSLPPYVHCHVGLRGETPLQQDLSQATATRLPSPPFLIFSEKGVSVIFSQARPIRNKRDSSERLEARAHGPHFGSRIEMLTVGFCAGMIGQVYIIQLIRCCLAVGQCVGYTYRYLADVGTLLTLFCSLTCADGSHYRL